MKSSSLAPLLLLCSTVLYLVLFITGCGSANTNTSSPVVIHDTVIVQVLSGEVTPVTGEKPVKRIEFNRAGQVATFRQGEVVELIMNGVDMNRVTLQTETNPLTNEVTISTVDIDDLRVVLRSKCDIIERRGIARIPAIDIDSSLDARKIVIMPIFNNGKECEVLGYQIRFDSEERDGCKEKVDFSVYNTCVGKKTRPAQKKRKRNLEQILFGT